MTTPPSSSDGAAPARDDIAAVLGDLAVVFLFAWAGRASHAEALSVPEISNTALPFWVGALIGHVIVRYTRNDPRRLSWGALILTATFGVGHAGRLLVGQTSELAFLAVSAGFLTLGLLGWRAGLLLVRRWRNNRGR